MKIVFTKKLIAIGIVVVLVGAGAMAYSVRARSTNQNSSAGTASMASGGTVRKPTSGSVHLSEYTNGDGVGASVILTGAIGDFGEAISVYPNGALNLEHNSQVNLALNQGSFKLDVSAVDKKIVDAFTRFKSHPATCSGNLTASGTATVVPGSGTGTYQGISGSFDLTVYVDEIDKACSGNDAYLAQAFVTLGNGTVTLK